MLNYKKDNRKAGLRLVFDYLHRHIVAVIVIIAVVSGVIATVTIVQNREEAEKVEPGKITELAETDEIRLATSRSLSMSSNPPMRTSTSSTSSSTAACSPWTTP